jgi:ER lumen protein retaining receptor
LYALVFSTRYLDLVTMWFIPIPDGLSIWDFVSVYNTVLKFLYLGTTYGLLLMFLLFRDTYDADNDQFCKTSVVLPAMILAYNLAYYDEWVEIFWTFSIFLEVVAMLPQLLLFRAFPCSQIYDGLACRCIPGGCPARSICCPLLPKPQAPIVPGAVATMAGPATVDGLLWFYVLCMACYRAFYLLNWVWRYHTQPNYWDPIVWASGVCQTSLFMPFFYYYISRFMQKGARYSLLETEDLDVDAEYGSTKEEADNVKVAKEIVQQERDVISQALTGKPAAASAGAAATGAAP